MGAQAIQQVVVAVIVVAALLHFCSKYLPAAWRQQIVYFLTRRGFDQTKMATLFKTKSSCGDGCSSCGSCDTPAAPDASSSSSPSPSAKRRFITVSVRLIELLIVADTLNDRDHFRSTERPA